MKYLLLLLFPAISNAATLTFVNYTGAPVRIVELRNKCTGFMVTEKTELTILNRRSYMFSTTSVVHTYKICGNGYCSSSAIGMLPNKNYRLEIVLDGNVPSVVGDDFPGNLNCPE